jgi:hypothetical protein
LLLLFSLGLAAAEQRASQLQDRVKTAEAKTHKMESALKKFGSRKFCHFAMTQAFLDQMECLGALQMA